MANTFLFALKSKEGFPIFRKFSLRKGRNFQKKHLWGCNIEGLEARLSKQTTISPL